MDDSLGRRFFNMKLKGSACPSYANRRFEIVLIFKFEFVFSCLCLWETVFCTCGKQKNNIGQTKSFLAATRHSRVCVWEGEGGSCGGGTEEERKGKSVSRPELMRLFPFLAAKRKKRENPLPHKKHKKKK